MYVNTADLFWARVDIAGPDECWLWTGPLIKGYGQATFAALDPKRGRSPYRAHRLAWALTKGEGVMPERTMHVHHTCGVKACVNPKHLELLSASDHLKLHRGLSVCPHCGERLTYKK